MDIVSIPGSMLDSDVFTDVRPGLERLGRVIDADTSKDASVAAMAARAIQALDGPSLIIGLSMGGYVAREIAYRAPELVAGLALVATSTRAVPERPAITATQFRQVSRAAVERSPRRRSEQMTTAQLLRVPSARSIARLMTKKRDHPTKAETVMVAAIEAGARP